MARPELAASRHEPGFIGPTGQKWTAARHAIAGHGVRPARFARIFRGRPAGRDDALPQGL